MSSIDPNSFTDRTNQVLQAATQAAIEAASSGGTTPVHLFEALLEESSGFARRVLLRCTDGSIDGLVSATKQAVASLPKQTPAPTEAAPNMALIKLLQSAQMASKSAGDSVTSLSHLLMASLNDVSCPASADVSVLYTTVFRRPPSKRSSKQIAFKQARSLMSLSLPLLQVHRKGALLR